MYEMSQIQDEKHPESNVNLLEPVPSTQTSRLQGVTNLVNRFWIVELSCVVVAIGAMAGMIGMLSYLNNSTLDAWTLKISPNTILAILANLCKAVMVTVIATCIAQLRWPYFASAPQPLADFDTFDGATRGPWGALKFMFAVPFTRGRLSSIASFAAVLMVFSVAIDPFAQQMLKYETDSVPTTGGATPARIPVNKGIASGKTILGRGDAWQSIYGGFLGFDYPVPYDCHNGNCTWPNFVTLALCSSCQDAGPLMSFQCASSSGNNDTDCSTVTSRVQGTDIIVTFKNGSQPLVAAQDGSKAYTLVKGAVGSPYPGGFGDPTLFEFVTAQLLVNLSSPMPSQFQPQWNLTLCAVKWCARVFENVTVRDGTLSQPEARKVELYEDTTSNCTGSNVCQQFVTRDSLGVPDIDNATYRIDLTQDSAEISKLFTFDDDIDAFKNGTWDVGGAFSVTGTIFWGIDVIEATSKSASTFSNYLRANHVYSAYVEGITLVRTTFIRVRWAWIGLPATLVVMSTLLLAATVIQTRSRTLSSKFLWKSSTLPLLFYPLDDNAQERHRQSEPLTTLAARGDTVRGQFIDNGSGGVSFVMRDRG